ncbi:MAG: HEAT repeat domain-containing protein [Phycisphaerae bacterium]|nr:HEAT repeat domain-containing protein [Phycisphaerae bacterium]
MKQISLNSRFTSTLLFALLVSNGIAFAGGKSPLHLPRTSEHRGNFTINDAQGYRWDIYTHYGTIQGGTNNAFSNGVYLHINGSNFYSNNSRGYLSKARDEIEIGPWSRSNLRISRRLKIFKKEGIARWLDIYENPTGQDININIKITSQLAYGHGSTKTVTGKASPGPKDWAFYVKQRNNRPPMVLHIPFGPRAKTKIRPRISIQNNRVEYQLNCRIPARKTVVLAYFAKQHSSAQTLEKTMKTFRPYKFFADLKPEVRKLILNFNATGGMYDVDIERTEQSDQIKLVSGDPMFGVVENKSFRMKTFFGEMTLPAKRTIGMALRKGNRGTFQAVLSDGQVVCGTLPDQKLRIKIPSVGIQQIPFSDISNWSFKISADRPAEVKFQGPFLVMRTGDRLAFKADSLKLKLKTRNGTVDLDPATICRIKTDNPSHSIHKVEFLNGSVLSGLIEQAEIPVQLRLCDKQTIKRDMITGIEFAVDVKATPPAATVILSNGDKLFGRLDEKQLQLKGKYGNIKVNPASIKSLHQVPSRQGEVKMKLWNNSVFQGVLVNEELRFQLVPGPTVLISPAQIASLEQTNALPPGHVVKDITKLVAQLGSESYKDRKAAQDTLTKMGAEVIPILKKHANSKDPEIRQRIAEILETLKASSSSVNDDGSDGRRLAHNQPMAINPNLMRQMRRAQALRKAQRAKAMAMLAQREKDLKKAQLIQIQAK